MTDHEFQMAVVQRLTSIEEKVKDLPAVKAKLDEHEKALNWARGVGAVLHLFWAATIAYLFRK